MTIQEALSAALVHGLCIRRGAPIGDYNCIKPTKPSAPLMILQKTSNAALTKSGRPKIYWTPNLEDILACDWMLTTGYPTGSFSSKDAAGDAAQQIEAK